LAAAAVGTVPVRRDHRVACEGSPVKILLIILVVVAILAVLSMVMRRRP
jgi:hypothetical protein